MVIKKLLMDVEKVVENYKPSIDIDPKKWLIRELIDITRGGSPRPIKNGYNR